MRQKKYQIDTEENRAFLTENFNQLLAFGHRFPSPSGSAYWLGDDGTPWKDRPRETWITARMVHVYSLGTMLHHDGSETLVDAGMKGLKGELYDNQNGGWYPGILANGTIEPDKLCYTHAFVMLAASSAMLAGRPGAEELLSHAETLFLKRFWDEQNGLAYDTWNTTFTKLNSYRGLNANMHTVEASLALADATGDEAWRERAGRIIDHVCDWAQGNHWRIPEHYTRDWQPDLLCNQNKPDDPFKPFGATPGHGIEWARLITQYAFSRFPASDGENAFTISSGAQPYLTVAEHLYWRAVNDGWNVDGAPGIVYTTDWDGKPVVHDRMHWTLAEAINTSALLYHVTGNQKYAENYYDFISYLDTKVIDHVNGSWYHQLDRHNNLKNTVWPGKSDLYHAVQAMLLPYLRPDVSIAKAVYDLERKNA